MAINVKKSISQMSKDDMTQILNQLKEDQFLIEPDYEAPLELCMDCAIEGDPKQVDEKLKELDLKYNINHNVNTYEGPGGGWPEISFYGERENLKLFYEEWYCGGQDPESFDSFEFFLGEEK